MYKFDCTVWVNNMQIVSYKKISGRNKTYRIFSIKDRTRRQRNRRRPQLVAAFIMTHLMSTHAKITLHHASALVDRCLSSHSEATSRLASENDSSSDTEDPFASANEDEGELEKKEIVLEDGCWLCVLAASYYGRVCNVHVLWCNNLSCKY